MSRCRHDWGENGWCTKCFKGVNDDAWLILVLGIPVMCAAFLMVVGTLAMWRWAT